MAVDPGRPVVRFRHVGGITSGMDVAGLRAIIPQVRDLLSAARERGVPVIHTREGHRSDLSDLSAVKRRRAAGAGAPIGSVGPLGRLLVRGEPGHAIVEELTLAEFMLMGRRFIWAIEVVRLTPGGLR